MGLTEVIKRIAVSEETATQIQKLAASKGVSMGKYLRNLVNYVLENGIDYSSPEGLLGQNIRKEIDRPIKILRAFEKTYLLPLLVNSKLLSDHLTPVLEDFEQQEMEQLEVVDVDEGVNEQLKLEVGELTNTRNLMVERLRWLIEDKAKTDKKGVVTIEMTSKEYELYKNTIAQYVR